MDLKSPCVLYTHGASPAYSLQGRGRTTPAMQVCAAGLYSCRFDRRSATGVFGITWTVAAVRLRGLQWSKSMIARIRGILLERDLTDAVIDVHGVAFSISIPVSTYEKLPPPGHEVQLLTHLQVREDAMELYGFATEEERQLFRLLLGVSGIGTRLALNVLSSMTVTEFCRNILSGDVRALSRINGIGKRSAERMVVELRERVEAIQPAAAGGAAEEPVSRDAQDAITALETLGFRGEQARKAVRAAVEEIPREECTAERLIRRALQILNS